MPLHVSSMCAHHQEVKFALHSIWYHHTHIGGHLVHRLSPISTCARDGHLYVCDDTRGCVMQFWPPDDDHMCSKHVQAWNKLIVKQNVCVSSWLITEINITCTPSLPTLLYQYKLSKPSTRNCSHFLLTVSRIPTIQHSPGTLISKYLHSPLPLRATVRLSSTRKTEPPTYSSNKVAEHTGI